jgi:hypothetical protein
VSHKFTCEKYSLPSFVMTTINLETLRFFESLNRKQYELDTKVTALKDITDSTTYQEYIAEIRNGIKELARKIEVGVYNGRVHKPLRQSMSVRGFVEET